VEARLSVMMFSSSLIRLKEEKRSNTTGKTQRT
jgi:hypothetical protein